jgi:hypothetical protein
VLPARYEGRTDIPYVPRGMAVDEVRPLQDQICALLSEGVSLLQITKRAGMPSMPTIYAMLRLDPVFATNYTRAREEQAETFADEIASIADSAQGLDAAGVNAARLRVDARKWCASKLLPKRYGDRIDVQHAGGISVAAVSKALKTVEPITFDEDGNELGTDDANSSEHASDAAQRGMLTAIGKTHADQEQASDVPAAVSEDLPPHPLPPPPGKGTPVTVTTRVTPVAQNPEIPSKFRQSYDGNPTYNVTMGSPRSYSGGSTADQARRTEPVRLRAAAEPTLPLFADAQPTLDDLL